MTSCSLCFLSSVCLVMLVWFCLLHLHVSYSGNCLMTWTTIFILLPSCSLMNRHDDSHLHYRSSLFLEKDRETEKRPKEDNTGIITIIIGKEGGVKRKGSSPRSLFLLTQTQEKQLKNSWRSQVKESANLLIEWTQQRKWRFSLHSFNPFDFGLRYTLFFGNISFAELRTFWWEIIIASLLCVGVKNEATERQETKSRSISIF